MTKVILTGFKKFGPNEINPTELIINKLVEDKEWQEKNNVVEIVNLDVIVDKIKEFIKDLSNKIINEMRIEKCCYNLMDFPIPDEAGYQVNGTAIDDALPIDKPIESKINVLDLFNKLKVDHMCQISLDPGRYICNYVLYLSSQLAESHPNVYSLFVHFPKQETIDLEHQVAFAKDLVSELTKMNNDQE